MVLAGLRDLSPLVRRAAAWTAPGFPTYGKHLAPALIKALDDKGLVNDPGGGAAPAAALALGRLGPASRVALPALIRKARAADHALGASAVGAIGNIGRFDKGTLGTVVPALVAVLKERGPHAGQAAWLLGQIGPGAKAAVPELAAALRDRPGKDAEAAAAIRGGVLQGLAGIGPDSRAAVPELVAVLGDVRLEWEARQWAAKALGAIGPAAKAAVPALEKASKDRGGDVRVCVAADAALAEIRARRPQASK
jgi:hypothetical protein